MIIDEHNNTVSKTTYLSPPELFRLLANFKAESASNVVTLSSTKSSKLGPFASFSFCSFVSELWSRKEILKFTRKEINFKRPRLTIKSIWMYNIIFQKSLHKRPNRFTQSLKSSLHLLATLHFSCHLLYLLHQQERQYQTISMLKSWIGTLNVDNQISYFEQRTRTVGCHQQKESGGQKRRIVRDFLMVWHEDEWILDGGA